LATSLSYVNQLRNIGCKLIFYIEYLPTDSNTGHLSLDENGIAEMESNLEKLRTTYDDSGYRYYNRHLCRLFYDRDL